MLSVRGLLSTRCEANAVIADTLLKRVGLEPAAGSGGGAVVINSSNVSASPVNHVLSKPLNHVHTMAAAASKVGGGWGRLVVGWGWGWGCGARGRVTW